MTQTFAFYIGGALDNQRHVVASLPPIVWAARMAEPASAGPGAPSRPLRVIRQKYVMFSPPVNPRALNNGAGTAVNADFGVYYFVDETTE